VVRSNSGSSSSVYILFVRCVAFCLLRVCQVPITFNYDRVLEGETFPMELLGEQKVYRAEEGV